MRSDRYISISFIVRWATFKGTDEEYKIATEPNTNNRSLQAMTMGIGRWSRHCTQSRNNQEQFPPKQAH